MSDVENALKGLRELIQQQMPMRAWDPNDDEEEIWPEKDALAHLETVEREIARLRSALEKAQYGLEYIAKRSEIYGATDGGLSLACLDFLQQSNMELESARDKPKPCETCGGEKETVEDLGVPHDRPN